jgi:DNA polymerase-3 subunit beta
MLSQIDHAIARKDINPALMGARFDIENNMICIVASDAVRLALRKEILEFNDMGFIVPEKTVVELTRNLVDDDESEVTVIIDRNQIGFSKKNYMIFSRLLDGKFVEYKKLVETQSNREIIINTRELTYSLERSLLFINERFKSPVVCEINHANQCINLSCNTGLGEFNEEISVIKTQIKNDYEQNSEKNFCIAFNPRFMIDALRNVNCDEVRLEFMSELAPIKVTPPSGDDVLFVVVPVRLK